MFIEAARGNSKGSVYARGGKGLFSFNLEKTGKLHRHHSAIHVQIPLS